MFTYLWFSIENSRNFLPLWVLLIEVYLWCKIKDMATLTGTHIKDTYTGLMKTTDNAGITTTLKRITDGAGSSTALQLSDSTARIDALEITTVVENSGRTKLLNWDSSDGVVGYYSLSSSDPAVSASISGDDVTVTTGTNASNTFTLISGANMSMTLSGTQITLNATTTGFDDLFASSLGNGSSSSSVSLAASATGKTFELVNTSPAVTTINLPGAAAGLNYEFVCTATTPGSFRIVCATGDAFSGGVDVTNNGVHGSLSDTRVPYTMSAGTSSGNNRITLSSAVTSGNKKGSYLRVVAKDSTTWIVSGHLYNAITYTQYAPGGTAINGIPATTEVPAPFDTV